MMAKRKKAKTNVLEIVTIKNTKPLHMFKRGCKSSCNVERAKNDDDEILMNLTQFMPVVLRK